jgi:serine/threonine protein kinase
MTGPLTPEDPVRVALERAIGFQYEILRLLGRGGMGAVYHAHERALDRPVAIKVLPPHVDTADGREWFLREARTAARLTHPNIVALHTFGETHGLIYDVVGYVDGESLEQPCRARVRSFPRAARATWSCYARSCCRCARFAHSRSPTPPRWTTSPAAFGTCC